MVARPTLLVQTGSDLDSKLKEFFKQDPKRILKEMLKTEKLNDATELAQ